MKNCPEMEEMLVQCIGDNVVGFFYQEKSDDKQDVSVFTLVSNTVRSDQALN